MTVARPLARVPRRVSRETLAGVATAVGAAVGPARAIETAPVALVAAQVSGQAVA